MAPSSFASAAAGVNSSRDISDWPRRPNGATQTFRRPSASTSVSSIAASQPQDPSTPGGASGPRYVPPHRNGTIPDTRYSKDQLLELFRAQQSAEAGLKDELSSLFVGAWHPDGSNGTSGTGWGRTEHNRDVQPGSDICWDRDGSMEPLGLVEMDDEERELFSTSVNTPLKTLAGNKENQQSNGVSGRKISVSGQATTPGGYGPLSPSISRGAGRRRETSESYPFPSNPLASPAAGVHRDDAHAPSPPPALTRRRTDVKESNRPAPDKEADTEDKSSSNPFGSLKRNPTGPLNAGFGAPASPWSNAPPSAGLSPMGSFGNFGLGQQNSAPDKRPVPGNVRAESRFKNLLNKDTSEDSTVSKSVERRSSINSLTRVEEEESWRSQHPSDLGAELVDETDEDVPTGSAALGANVDLNPSNTRQGNVRGFGAPGRSDSRDDYGFGAFGMTSDNLQGFGQNFMHGQHAFQHNAGQARPLGNNEPTSPTDTNPYRSPEQHGIDRLPEDLEGDGAAQLPGLGGFGNDQAHYGALGGLGALPNLARAQGSVSDRSQTSSVGPNRGFPSLGAFGQLGGISGAAAWPTSQGGLGTPGRQTAGLSNAFGGGLFANSMADVHSPGLAGLGSGILSPPGPGGMGPSKMSSLFPPHLQDSMRQGDQDRDGASDRAGPSHLSGANEYGRPAEAASGYEGSQGEQEGSAELQPPSFGAPGQPAQQQGQPGPPQPTSSASNQPPPPQQRTMVMPDRMRWIYRDPQGQTQGPWTGLEMHDWYKAGFFSPELLVKKFEDPDYEPLAQLIRRIGNSREPFLVPQIGIPHGPPTTAGPSAWPNAPTTTGGAQPPFASSFPSFGTTLTAEQQNALERRKQEEQYLMARQKEHLAQQQIAQRMQHHQLPPGGPGAHAGLAPGTVQLHHQTSAQSLHSQPSYGSMTSPTAGPFQPSPMQGPQGHAAGFFDNSFRGPGQAGAVGSVGAGVDSLGHIREEEIPGIMDRLNIGNRAGVGQFGAPGQAFTGKLQTQSSSNDDRDRQVQQMLQDRTRLQQEQIAHDAQQASDDERKGQNERLQQFQQLQGSGAIGGLDARFQTAVAASSAVAALREQASAERPGQEPSLTEQVQKAASAQQSPAAQQAGFPRPFPPTPSQSPLPAPAAQRTGRQSVADQLQTEQRDLSQTPSVETPNAAIAPWAKEPVETQKGPSLKEIQEMEAKKAAEAEEVASAARRAALQRDLEAQASAQAAPAAPGLPASASWAAAGGSPATPTGGGASAWVKAMQKPTGPTTAKSMAQIQKEEELRKRKIAAQVAQAQAQATAMSGVPSPAGGKSYANLAGKVSATLPVAGGGAWTTVGAGGKSKTPTAPAVVPAPPTRSVTSGGVPAAAAGVGTTVAVRKTPGRSATSTNLGGINAQEEFRKWAIGELRPDLNRGISAEDFVSNLLAIGASDPDILTEAVHASSSTIDSRHFADEFVRRKKLADKGLVDTSLPPKSASPHHAGASPDKSGGWSEVAKKGPPKANEAEAQGNGHFRVVAAKKKGGKR